MKKLIYALVILAFAVSLNAQWVQMSNGIGVNKQINSLVKAGAGDYIYAGTFMFGVYRSDDLGVTWSQFGLNGQDVRALAMLGNFKFAGTQLGLYMTQDSVNMNNWSLTSLSTQTINCMYVYGTRIFAGTDANGIYYSSNNGTTWIQTSLSSGRMLSFASSGSNIYAGTASGVYLSTNNGVNWNQAGLSGQWVRSIGTLGNYVFADYGNNTGLYKSTNNGVNWTITTLTGRNNLSNVVSGNTFITGASNYPAGVGGVFSSSNNGTTWIDKTQGFTPIPSVYTMLISNNYIFAGTELSSIWRRPLSDLVGVQNISTEIPSSYSLSQNYPNPFNPTTKIKFDVARIGDVKIVVNDVMGREVQTLVNESLQPGTYETTFDGSKLSSGMYFYRLQAEGYSETRKMTLIK